MTGLARPVAVPPSGGQGENGQDGAPGSKSPIPDLKGRLPLPATPGGGLNPGEQGYEDQVAAEQDQAQREQQLSAANLSRSPASGLGRKLEEYGSINGATPPQGSPKPPKLELDVNAPVPPARPDEAKTPTGAGDEPMNGLLGSGDAEMAYNPTWKHEVYL